MAFVRSKALFAFFRQGEGCQQILFGSKGACQCHLPHIQTMIPCQHMEDAVCFQKTAVAEVEANDGSAFGDFVKIGFCICPDGLCGVCAQGLLDEGQLDVQMQKFLRSVVHGSDECCQVVFAVKGQCLGIIRNPCQSADEPGCGSGCERNVVRAFVDDRFVINGKYQCIACGAANKGQLSFFQICF